MKDKIKLVTVALSVFVFIILFAITLSSLIAGVSKEVSKELTPYLENSAQCESIGGKYGSGKCFVDGKEVSLGE